METTVPEITRYGSIALFLLAVAFVLAAPFFWQHVELTDVPASESYENSDLYQFVYPAMHYAYGRVRTGQAPQWNARQMCGMPLLADHRIGLFQPLNAVFLLPDTGQAMALHSFICLALMGFGCVLFARSLDLDYGAALVGGIVYAFAGASAAAMSRPHLASALAWMPFLFWASREFARSGRRGWALLAGLAGAAFILSGAYAIVAVTLPLVVLYTILHGFTRRPGEFGLRIALGGILLGGALALCLAAVQWVPTAAWAMTLDSPADALWYLRSGGLLPGSFREAVVQTFSSRPGDLPRLCYVGMLPLILVPAACFQRKNWRETLVFLLAGAGAWALGAVGPQRVVAGLPREAFLYLAVFCVAVLAALGADRIFKPRKDYRSVHVWPVAIVVFLALCGVFYVAEGQGRGYVIAFAILLAPFFVLLVELGLGDDIVDRLHRAALLVDRAARFIEAKDPVFRVRVVFAPTTENDLEVAAVEPRRAGLRVGVFQGDVDVEVLLPFGPQELADGPVPGGVSLQQHELGEARAISVSSLGEVRLGVYDVEANGGIELAGRAAGALGRHPAGGRNVRALEEDIVERLAVGGLREGEAHFELGECRVLEVRFDAPGPRGGIGDQFLAQRRVGLDGGPAGPEGARARQCRRGAAGQ